MKYIGVFHSPDDQLGEWSEYYGDGRALYVEADTAEQAAQMMIDNSEIQKLADESGCIWWMSEMPDDLEGSPLPIAESGERIRITVMDCVLRGSDREWHALYMLAKDPKSPDAIAMQMHLPYNQDIRDAIIGVFMSADDWVIGAMASGLYQSDAYHYHFFELQVGFDYTRIVADRTIDRKYTTVIV